MDLDRLRIRAVSFTDTDLELHLAGGRTVRGGLQLNWPALGRAGGAGITVAAADLAWEQTYEAALARLAQADWKLDALPARLQQIVALWRLEADGYNGGFLQFFCNWGEANCVIALQALQAIGAEATHAVVSEQRAMLDRLEGHPEMKSYGDIPRLLSEAERTRIGDELDPAFWEAAEELPWRAACHYFDES